MANKKDYYEVLGVAKGAGEDEIKSAFRKQAKTCHPDLHPGDASAEAKFKELNEAAEVLSDPQKRAQYDQFGHAAFDPASGGGYSAGGSPFSGFGGFSDIFETMFGGGFSSGNNSNAPVKGENIRYSMSITFEDAAFGVKRDIIVPREQACDTCHGSGAKPGTSPETCSACGGAGQRRVQQNTILGSFSTVRTCSACNGTGKIIKEPCLDCRGSGRQKKNSRVIVDIPAGIDDGQILNISGEGQAGYRNGPNGDLRVTVAVKAHKSFRRNGFDLLLDLKIPFAVAVMGGEIQIPTLTGKLKYAIPEGTQTGTTFRLRDQGIQHLYASAKGDLLVKVEVEVPKRLTARQKELLQAFSDAMGDQRVEAKTNKRTVFGKVKDALNND